MIGRYEIEVYNAQVHYFLTVKRNITILQGDSASGKSELVRLLSEYNSRQVSSGITVKCEKRCSVLTAEDWQERIAMMHDRIIFIDEGNYFVKSKDFAEAINGSDNYFVIINRDSLTELPYSINEIYGLRENTTSKYIHPGQVYNEMYQLYNPESIGDEKALTIITEDSKSGYQLNI